MKMAFLGSTIIFFTLLLNFTPFLSDSSYAFVPGDYFDLSIKVNPSDKKEVRPSIAIDELGNAHILWEDYRNGNSDIYYTSWDASSPYKYTTEGFSNEIKVSDSEGSFSQRNPDIAVDKNGMIYAVWEDNRKGSDFDIYFAKSSDGKTFSKNIIVNDYIGDANQLNPEIVVDSDGVIYVAYEDDRLGKSDIYLTRSLDGGLTFGPSVRVNNETEGYQSYPSMVVNQTGVLFIAWQDSRNGNWDVYFTYSETLGVDFHEEVRINEISEGNQMQPSITTYVTYPTYQNYTYVVWVDDRDGEQDLWGCFVSISYSENNGNNGDNRANNANITPMKNVIIHGEQSSEQSCPSVYSDAKGMLYILWHDVVPGNSSIKLTRSYDGEQFENITVIGESTNSKTDGVLGVNYRLGILCIVWVELDNIYFTYSGKVDLYLGSSAVILSPAHPNDKEETKIYLSVSNLGSVGVKNIRVQFCDYYNESGTNNTLLSTKLEDIEYIKPEGYIKLEIKDTFKKGRHLLKFTADIDDRYIEIDEENNEHVFELKVEEGGLVTTDLAILIGSAIFCAIAIFLAVYYVTRDSRD